MQPSDKPTPLPLPDDLFAQRLKKLKCVQRAACKYLNNPPSHTTSHSPTHILVTPPFCSSKFTLCVLNTQRNLNLTPKRCLNLSCLHLHAGIFLRSHPSASRTIAVDIDSLSNCRFVHVSLATIDRLMGRTDHKQWMVACFDIVLWLN